MAPDLRTSPLTAPDACPERRIGVIIERIDDTSEWRDLRHGTLAEVRVLNEKHPVFPDEDARFGWVPRRPIAYTH
jgi:hypothetical protein